jgi:glutamate dehydrogenase (NAD(P)+)
VTQRRATRETTTAATASTPLAAAREQLAEAADALDLEFGLHEVRRSPQREATVRFRVEMDGGPSRVITGYHVGHTAPVGRLVLGRAQPPGVRLDAPRHQRQALPGAAAVIR